MENDSDTIDPIYPYCSCLPLYCLKNYEELDEDLEDFEADIDYSGARVTLRVCDWEIEEALVVTI